MRRFADELEQANLKLQDLSQTDGLTQLYNRRHFSAVFEQEFKRAAREKKPLSLLQMDIDHFKNINYT
ncbi:GGDEF domain-containing protein, partial [Staphylococcus pseudintermedius]|uniref:GGDEF domain-containing protein n=1 Tax=Staphylococcus pseudintermedius TaxID=283734 RepID=UPI0010215EC9